MRYFCRQETLNELSLGRFQQLLAIAGEGFIDVNCIGTWGSSPLMLLCQNMKTDSLYDCVQDLLRRPDIKINQTDSGGMNALMYLCRYSRSDKIVQVAQLFIDKEINVNQTDKDGKNALMRLMCRHSISSVKILQITVLLIEKGITIYHKDFKGRNASYYLFQNQHLMKTDEVIRQELTGLLGNPQGDSSCASGRRNCVIS